MTIGLIAGLLSLVAFSIYIYAIWFKTTRPSRSSWWIISVVWIVLLSSSIDLTPGVDFLDKWSNVPANWIALAYIVSSLIIAISSVWKGASERWGMFDYACAVLAAISLVTYFVFEAPLVGLLTALLADFFGILPTVKNAWLHPENEHFFAWALEVVASFFTLSIVTNWALTSEGFAQWGSPIYLVVMNTLITLFILRRFIFKKS